MEVLTVVLSLLILLKVGSISRALRWMASGGALTYRNDISQFPQPSESQRVAAFAGSGAAGFPFGVQDYQLHHFVLTAHPKTTIERIRLRVVRAFLLIYRFPPIVLGITLWVVVGASVDLEPWLLTTRHVHNWSLYALSATSVVANILLSLEAACSYAVIGGYGRYFHAFRAEPGTQFVVELQTLALVVGTAVTAAAGSAYVACVAFKAVAGATINCSPDGFYESAVLLLQMLYWVTTILTTVGFGDIVPKNGFGQLVAFLIEVQAFALVVLVFASLFASKDRMTDSGTGSSRH